MRIKQYHLIISGRVQGVSYRFSAWEKARQLGLTDWIRNLADGRVQIVIEGILAMLDQMIKWAGKGPQFVQGFLLRFLFALLL
ncbi:MAG: acylphosphatase [Methylophaga sp.]|nr:acylphosphatase [Methylophaga sp.]